MKGATVISALDTKEQRFTKLLLKKECFYQKISSSITINFF